MTCAHGDLRETCPKGVYCFYKHQDDIPIAPAEAVRPAVKVPEAKQIEASETTAFPPPAAKASPKVAPPTIQIPSATAATVPPKQAVAGRKRGLETELEHQGQPNKARRVEKRQNHPRERRESKGDIYRPSQGSSEHTGRGRGQNRLNSRGRGCGRRRSVDNESRTSRQHTGQGEGIRGGSLRSRMTHD